MLFSLTNAATPGERGEERLVSAQVKWSNLQPVA